MFFDTHAHLDDERFDEDRAALIAALPALGITRVLNASSDLASSRRTVALCAKYDFIYGAVGVHPHETAQMTDADLDALAALFSMRHIQAVGEIGLDYYYDLSPRDVQQARLRDQLLLARQYQLPVVIHERDAHEDCLRILRDFTDLSIVYHCYSGSLEYAKILISLGFYLSFTGAITFKNAKAAPAVAAWMPQDRIMIETDSPYLAPVPYRGKRNFPGYVPLVAEKIAALRGVSVEEIARITYENGSRFFRIS